MLPPNTDRNRTPPFGRPTFPAVFSGMAYVLLVSREAVGRRRRDISVHSPFGPSACAQSRGPVVGLDHDTKEEDEDEDEEGEVKRPWITKSSVLESP